MDSEAPKHKTQPPLSFGLLLKPEQAASVLERGPPADSPKVMSHICLLCVDVGKCASEASTGFNHIHSSNAFEKRVFDLSNIVVTVSYNVIVNVAGICTFAHFLSHDLFYRRDVAAVILTSLLFC